MHRDRPAKNSVPNPEESNRRRKNLFEFYTRSQAGSGIGYLKV